MQIKKKTGLIGEKKDISGGGSSQSEIDAAAAGVGGSSDDNSASVMNSGGNFTQKGDETFFGLGKKSIDISPLHASKNNDLMIDNENEIKAMIDPNAILNVGESPAADFSFIKLKKP